MTALEKRLKKLSRLSDRALLGSDGKFYVFGEGITECLYVEGHMSRKVPKEKVWRIRSEKTYEEIYDDPNDEDSPYKLVEVIHPIIQDLNTNKNRLELFEKAARTYEIKYDELLAEFPITGIKRRELAKRIIDEDATHFQIDCDRAVNNELSD
jgi:hypothetical protein